jgi:broad specificity phosphatase PhoE
MKRVYFVRHGESEANVARVHGGPHHPLSKKGMEQAKFIAGRFAKLPIQTLYSSDLLRAQQTSATIAERIGLPLHTKSDLQEVGMPSHFMERRFDTPETIEMEMQLIENMAPGRRQHDEETFDEIISRAGRVLDWLSQLPEDHVGIVTHGLFLRCIIARAIFGIEVTPHEVLVLWRGLKSENTGLTILEYKPDTPKRLWQLFTWNDHAHLG